MVVLELVVVGVEDFWLLYCMSWLIFLVRVIFISRVLILCLICGEVSWVLDGGVFVGVLVGVVMVVLVMVIVMVVFRSSEWGCRLDWGWKFIDFLWGGGCW